MRKPAVFIFVLIMMSFGSLIWASEDYFPRYIRNYPPGFNSMWYQAERFHSKIGEIPRGSEKYRFDRHMSRVTGLSYPFFPVPYDWDYGTGRTFNLPDYNRNDWHR
jgi:hypothetical protein